MSLTKKNAENGIPEEFDPEKIAQRKAEAERAGKRREALDEQTVRAKIRGSIRGAQQANYTPEAIVKLIEGRLTEREKDLDLDKATVARRREWLREELLRSGVIEPSPEEKRAAEEAQEKLRILTERLQRNKSQAQANSDHRVSDGQPVNGRCPDPAEACRDILSKRSLSQAEPTAQPARDRIPNSTIDEAQIDPRLVPFIPKWEAAKISSDSRDHWWVLEERRLAIGLPDVEDNALPVIPGHIELTTEEEAQRDAIVAEFESPRYYESPESIENRWTRFVRRLSASRKAAQRSQRPPVTRRATRLLATPQTGGLGRPASL
jgi:hypothetical protein